MLMKRTSLILAASVLAALGCRKVSDEDSGEKFDRIMARLDAMDKKIDQIAQGRGAGMAQPQRPQEPDPRSTYAVPVTDADHPRGPATAKVTIVEAADFA
jgi:protein-disulfide isomerase